MSIDWELNWFGTCLNLLSYACLPAWPFALTQDMLALKYGVQLVEFDFVNKAKAMIALISGRLDALTYIRLCGSNVFASFNLYGICWFRNCLKIGGLASHDGAIV